MDNNKLELVIKKNMYAVKVSNGQLIKISYNFCCYEEKSTLEIKEKLYPDKINTTKKEIVMSNEEKELLLNILENLKEEGKVEHIKLGIAGKYRYYNVCINGDNYEIENNSNNLKELFKLFKI